MAKKINKTKKYDHVESTVKTGKTVKDIEILSKLQLYIDEFDFLFLLIF